MYMMVAIELTMSYAPVIAIFIKILNIKHKIWKFSSDTVFKLGANIINSGTYNMKAGTWALLTVTVCVWILVTTLAK